MVDYLLILSLLFYACSIYTLFRSGRKRGIVGFVFLFWLHAIVGFGYLSLAMYRHWSWGEMHFLWDDVYFDVSVYWYVFFICLILWGFSYIRFRHWARLKIPVVFHQRAFSTIELFALAFLLLIYFAGIKFGTLRVGLDIPVVLPFRLNGIIEVVILFILPLYISLRILRFRGGFWLGMGIITVFAAINITSFGSKNSAIYPLAVFISVMLVIERSSLAKILLASLVVLSTYTLINPGYFREEIRSGPGLSSLEMIKESAEVRQNSDLSESKLILYGLRNLSHRITGIVPMQIAIGVSVPMWEAIEWREVVWDIKTYYNKKIMGTPFGTTYATGHFAYFMLMFGNHFIGICFGWLLLSLAFYVCLHLDQHIESKKTLRSGLVGITFVLLLLPFILDGNYDNLSGYLQFVFCILVTWNLFPLIFHEKGRTRGIGQQEDLRR